MKKMIGGNPNPGFRFIPIFLLLLIIGTIITNILVSIQLAPEKVNTIVSSVFGSIIFIILLISLCTNLIPAPYKYVNLLIVFVSVVLSNIITLFYVPEPVIYIPFYKEMNSIGKQLYNIVFDKKTQKVYNSANKKASKSSGINNSE